MKSGKNVAASVVSSQEKIIVFTQIKNGGPILS
jgi:hypothetical protein